MIYRYLFFVLVSSTFAIAGAVSQPPTEKSQGLKEWWQGDNASGEWFGLRPALKDHGLTFSGKWGASFFAVAGGGLGRGATFDEELRFDATLDFAKATTWEGFEGLTATAGVRWRDGQNINKYAGASPSFNPSVYQGGKQWRLMPFYLTYKTPELFGIKDFLTLSGGWQNPYDFFLQQPGSKFFRNNMILSSKAIASNGVGWSSSYAAWGGFVKVQPLSFYYAQAGLYMAIPEAGSTSNHGLDLAGAVPASRNGLFVIAETGFTPKLGSSQLPGKYAFGGYYWGEEASCFQGGSVAGRWGLYWQADQMLWREPSPDSGKDKDAAPTLSKQGLSIINYVAFAPPAESAIPFYFHTGLIYRGLIPTRDDDEVGVAFAWASYSGDMAQAEESRRIPVHTGEGVLEFDYRFQVNKWAYVQPFLQYIIDPGGRGQVANATVLGMHFGLAF